MKYPTIKTLYMALRRYRVPHYYSISRLEQYIVNNKLIISVENLDIDEEKKRRYIRKRIKRFVKDPDLQSIIEGLDIPLSVLELKTSLKGIYEKRQSRKK